MGGVCAQFVDGFKPLLGFSVPSFALLTAQPSQALRSCPCQPMGRDSKMTTQRFSAHLTHPPAVAAICVRCAPQRENGALPAQSWRSRSHAPKQAASEAGQRDSHAVKFRKMIARGCGMATAFRLRHRDGVAAGVTLTLTIHSWNFPSKDAYPSSRKGWRSVRQLSRPLRQM